MNKASVYLFICSFIFCVCFRAQAIYIIKQVPAGEQFCFTDDIPKHTLVSLNIQSDTEFVLQAHFSQNVLFSLNLTNKSPLAKTFTTQKYGIHRFCFRNVNSFQAKIKFDLAVGKKANDFGSPFDHEDYVLVLQNQARIAQQFIKDVVNQNAQGMSILLAESRDTYTFSCLYAFSTFFVGVSLILTYIQYKAIKKHLHVRKYL